MSVHGSDMGPLIDSKIYEYVDGETQQLICKTRVPNRGAQSVKITDQLHSI